ncbi:geranyl transferase [Tamilnaduibacter salinus]|uniref:Geranyl transferase n=1 Tax=Tamilnaduibacter salinus TaxID=1484056 RepID=A0A2A2I4H2_9GAMM|nr:farnesyl diphosphate synthase [Tamilnaduibacter salinus]PAV26025.1 geranyl transferase [Tamilnaduibacter salinus]
MTAAVPTSTLEQWREHIETCLTQWLTPSPGPASTLEEAMRYAALGGGKRIRPILSMAAAQASGGGPDEGLVPGCAVELIHAYSLVHDDLPAMDDDALRRGKPTVHIAFDEATAVLVGDALQTLAFEQLAANDRVPTATALAMVQHLARASGRSGMAGGQAIDLSLVGETPDLAMLETMHRHKTGALIETSILLGVLASGRDVDGDLGNRLQQYGRALGLAFQVRDDLLDIEGDTDHIGKPQGSDEARNKPTYPAILGIDGAREHLQALEREAHQSLDGLGPEADTLRDLIARIVYRRH